MSSESGRDQRGIALFIVNHQNFEKMLLRFFSETDMSISLLDVRRSVSWATVTESMAFEAATLILMCVILSGWTHSV